MTMIWLMTFFASVRGPRYLIDARDGLVVVLRLVG
ncbi:hypothetical protein J3D45_002403 [Microbacterium foliorum]|nr:hypothetical protein [Microbacterium foliorum]